MAMNEVGSAYVSIYPNTSGFNDKIADSLDIGKTGLGRLASDAFGKLGDLVMGSFDKGVQRFDTIQNFPKLMQTFGYSADEAAKSVNLVADHLQGLPGSTDEVLSLVQALSDSTSSLDLATTTGLAFNDMLTAGGADAATATYAMRTFDQIMGGGTITTQRWQSLVSKMPLQMRLLSEQILGAGASTEELGQALVDGDVSLEQFAQGMTDLGPVFEEQARAMSQGVGTALTNLPNRIAKGWEELFKTVGQENIANAIYGFADGIKNAMIGVADFITKFKKDHAGLLNAIGTNFERLGARIKIWAENTDWSWIEESITAVLTVIRDATDWILNHGDVVSSVLTGVGVALAGIWLAAKFEKLAGVLSGLFSIIASNPIGALAVVIGAVVAALVHFFTETEQGKEMWANFTQALSEGWEAFKELIRIGVQFLQDLFQAFVDFNITVWGTVIDFLSGIIEGIIEFVGNVIQAIIDFFMGIPQAASEAWDNVKSNASEAWQKIKDKIFGFAKQIVTDVKDKFLSIGTNAKKAWDDVKSKAANAWGNITSTIKDKAKGIVTGVKEKLDNIKSNAKDAWDNVKNNASTAWGNITSTIKDKAKDMVTGLKEKLDTIKSNAKEAWDNVKSNASEKWGSIKSTIVDKAKEIASGAKEKWNTLKSNAEEAFNNIKSIAGSIWGGIKSVITGKMDETSTSVKNSVSGTQTKINSLTGKTVTLGAKNAVSSVVDIVKNKIASFTGKTVSLNARDDIGNKVKNAQAKINGLKGKTVGVNVNVSKTGISEINVKAKAAGGGWFMQAFAGGGIATRATAGIFGEAGTEALIPLSNRNRVRPFARAVAAELGNAPSDGVTINIQEMNVRKESDIEQISYRLNQLVQRSRSGAL